MSQHHDALPNGINLAKSKKKRNFNWLSLDPPEDITPFQKFVREKAPLGPLGAIETWPTQLIQLVLVIVADPQPSIIYWGQNPTVSIYNEAYTYLIGQKHPGLMGQDPKIHFAEIWDPFQDILEYGENTGETHIGGQDPLILHRHGFLEETYFSFKFIPIVGCDGDVVGSLATVVEDTRDVLTERRLRSVRTLGQYMATAQDITGLWAQMLRGLETNEYDIPLALLYSVEEPGDFSEIMLEDHSPTRTICKLEGAIGVGTNHACAPLWLDVDKGTDGFAEAFRNATSFSTTESGGALISIEEGTLPEHLLEGIQWRGYGAIDKAIICPISSTSSKVVLGYLFLGLNPRRPYDTDYQTFIQLVTKQVTTPHVSAVLLREELRRRQCVAQQAALDKAQLSQQLMQKTQDWRESQIKFSRFAERAEVGLTIIDVEGKILYANDRWYEITMHPKDNLDAVSWMDSLIEEDRPLVAEMWDRLRSGKSVNYTARLNKERPGQPGNVAILCSAYPDLDENNQITSIMGCLTDVTELKLVEAQLRSRTLELEQSETKWRGFASKAPVGVLQLNPDYELEFANDSFYAITGHDRNIRGRLCWLNEVIEEDAFTLMRIFDDLPTFDGPITLEFRLKRYFRQTKYHSKTRITILCSLHALMDEKTGKLKQVVGWFTDISQQKFAEEVLRGKMDQAIEMKRQQENFIDMTSHEMRNPMSAVLGCADEITSSLAEYRSAITKDSSDSIKLTDLTKILDNTIDAAETIAYCVLHQKRIVDDILTLSRLDSDLLVIAPVAVQPCVLVKAALRIFEAEIKRAKIDLKFEEDESLKSLAVDWVMGDSSRIQQILINLLTNAIKFTRFQSKRQIIVKIGAHLEPPSSTPSGIKFVPRRVEREDHTSRDGWGNGEFVYLSVAVQDSGTGLTEDDRKLLFHRFSQASPKTHVKYGGSGLGLFISRQISEMHGGEIGVESEAGKGSTFMFYIRSRRTTAPPKAVGDANMQISAMVEDSVRDSCGAGLSRQNSSSQVLPVRPVHPEPIVPVQSTPNTADTLEVLVVEDNVVNQKVVVKQLRSRGCSVNVANHGEEALEFLERTAFWNNSKDGIKLSVILMDLEMPKMDGLTAVRRIRDLQKEGTICGHIPTIAVTANAHPDQIKAAMDAGMDDVTTKPYRIGDMLEQIKKLAYKHV